MKWAWVISLAMNWPSALDYNHLKIRHHLRTGFVFELLIRWLQLPFERSLLSWRANIPWVSFDDLEYSTLLWRVGGRWFYPAILI
jgi:hypothetical protein